MAESNFDLSRRGLMTILGMTVAAVAAGPNPALAAPARIANLFYTVSGKGRNIMLLHGWTCDSHDWSWQLPALESHYRVVAVDLRGHGRSEIMPPGSYMPGDYVRDIEALIERKFEGEKFILIGHSMGGQVAARLAAKRPDLVDAVVSVDGSLGFADSLGPIFKKAVDDLKTQNPGVVGPALFESVYDPSTDPALKRWHARRLQGTPEHPVRESFGPLFFGSDQVGLGSNSEAFCKTITVPFYHLCRDESQAARMRRWFSNEKSKVDVWKNAGHWIMQDRKDDVNSAIVSWVELL